MLLDGGAMARSEFYHAPATWLLQAGEQKPPKSTRAGHDNSARRVYA
tara:strand:- start:4061 stop:4201 length:141 start_codon:yes stop_codon:yes gene_type:complete